MDCSFSVNSASISRFSSSSFSSCYERKWNRRALAKKMGIMEASLSRSLNGNPTLETLEKIAKALDVSIKSLFNDPTDFEGFVLLHGNTTSTAFKSSMPSRRRKNGMLKLQPPPLQSN